MTGGAPSPLWAPSPTPSYNTNTTDAASSSSSPSSTITKKIASPPPPSGRHPVAFSPTLMGMVVVVAAAFLLITYSRPLSRHLILLIRRWRRRRRRIRHLLPSSSASTFSHLDSSPSPNPFPFDYSPEGFHVYSSSPYGLDDAVIKTIPLSIYSYKTNPSKNEGVKKECAVCLLELEEKEYVRTLPVCSHAFHVDCIDIWLRSHANCPLCRAGIFPPDSPFVPLMSSMIRPTSFHHHHDINNSVHTFTTSPIQQNTLPTATASTEVTEITSCIEEPSPRRRITRINVNDQSPEEEDNNNTYSNGYGLLKRSYSFGFERSSFLDASERMLLTEPATASPWRFRRRRTTFWTKRPLTPFKNRVFSFRHNYRGGGGGGGMIMKSPVFFRRRFPLSERFSNAGGSSSSRRSKYMASPMFQRSSATGVFCSSRLRCGDPEALLSPERLNGRR